MSNNITKEKIEQLNQSTIASYSAKPITIWGDYERELELTKDYNGRQLLELIQNAYDAGSDICTIELNTLNKTLNVSNNGSAFSFQGLESLNVANVSTKINKEFIGNKGLGFRSILNWVEEVTVQGRECSFMFSRNIANRFFKEVLLKEEGIKTAYNSNEKYRNLKNDFPIATLVVPEYLEEKVPDNYTTKIKIKYKLQFEENNIEEKIVEQMEELTEEILLFLPKFSQITLIKDNQAFKNLSRDKESSSDHIITINQNTWKIQNAEDTIDDDINFKYAIAWRDNLPGTDARFFTYFPTNESTCLPYIIHATFQLEANRKYLAEGEINKKILKKVGVKIVEITKNELKTRNTVDWIPYRFLTPLSSTSKLSYADFYKYLVEQREEIGAYPTVDNQYQKLNEVFYLGNEFSKWVTDNNLGSYFKGLLQEIPEGIDLQGSIPYNFHNFREIIKDLNAANALKIKQRVELIQFLVKNKSGFFSEYKKDDERYLPLLINNKNEAVNEETTVFTKIITEGDYYIPDFVQTKLSFIDGDFLERLEEALKDEIDKQRIDKESRTRTLNRILKPMVNIGSNDITDIVRLVVNCTREKLDDIKDDAEKTSIVQEAVGSLFSIYRKRDSNDSDKTTAVKNIPLLNRKGEIIDSDELYFGEEYSIGKKGEKIFDGIRGDKDYLAAPEVWKFKTDEASENELEDFFRWLNVNDYSKTSFVDSNYGNYPNYVFSKTEKPDNYTSITVKINKIDNFKEILEHDNFTAEKLIAWASLDSVLKTQIGPDHQDQFETKYSKTTKIYHDHPSYLMFQIHQSKLLNGSVLDFSTNGFSQIKSIDPEDEYFKQFGISPETVRYIAELLGIPSSLDSLTPETIYGFLKEFGQDSSNAKFSREFYKTIYEYFNKRKPLLDSVKINEYLNGVQYFCRKGNRGNEFTLVLHSEAYYSANKLLPQNFLDDLEFINLPGRIGEDTIKQYLGVKLIGDLKNEIKIESKRVNPGLTNILTPYFESVKPSLLAYRIEKRKSNESNQSLANNIKDLKLEVVNDISISLSGSKECLTIDEYEFIPLNDNDYYIKFSEHVHNIQTLLSKSKFCDALAEIVCIAFKVNDLTTYRRVVKDGPMDSEHVLKLDDKEAILEDAKRLLGVSSKEWKFWQKLFGDNWIKDGVRYDYPEYRKQLSEKIGYSLPEYYGKLDFEDLGNESGIEFLKWLLNLKPGLKLENLIDKNSLKRHHIRGLENEIYEQSKKVKQLLWNQANDGDEELKKTFFGKWENFENAKDDEENWKDFLDKNRYKLEPDYKEEVQRFARDRFSLNFNREVLDIEPEILYPHIFDSYKFGDDEEDMSKILKNEYPQIYSLLYFDGFQTEIKETLDLLSTESSNEDTKDDILLTKEAELRFGSMSFANNKYSPGKNSGSQGGSVTSKNNYAKVKAGKKAERLVCKILEKEGYEVEHVAKRTDGKHYDIRYKEKDGAEWRFLEVKKDSGGYFYLSKDEKETALGESAKYDIAIINATQVTIIKAPFKFDNEQRFEDNQNFKAEPNDYIIQFDFKKDSKDE